MKSELAMNPVLKTMGEVKNTLGVYYSIKNLNGLSDPYDPAHKMNFLRLLNFNFFLRPSIDEIDFVYNFLKKSYRDYFVNIDENLNQQYFLWFEGDERRNIAKNKESALSLIEEKIEEVIKSVLSKNKSIESMMERKSFIHSLIMSTERNKKIEFIFKNRNNYKGKLNSFVKLVFNYAADSDEQIVKVPSFLYSDNVKNNFSIYAVRDDKIIEIEGAYVYGAKLNRENNTLSLRIEIPDIYPNVYNFPFCSYDEKNEKFSFTMTDKLYGTKEEAKSELKNKIKLMRKSIKEISSSIAA